MIVIREVRAPEDLEAAGLLFRESAAASLDIDLTFQDFSAELGNLPGLYATPRGILLIAWEGDTALGCWQSGPLNGPASLN